MLQYVKSYSIFEHAECIHFIMMQLEGRTKRRQKMKKLRKTLAKQRHSAVCMTHAKHVAKDLKLTALSKKTHTLEDARTDLSRLARRGAIAPQVLANAVERRDVGAWRGLHERKRSRIVGAGNEEALIVHKDTVVGRTVCKRANESRQSLRVASSDRDGLNLR